MVPYQWFKSKSEELNSVQNSIRDVVNSLLPIELLNGYLPKKSTGEIITYTILTTDTIINHGLNRDYVGYLVIDRNASAIVYTSPTASLKNRQLILRASATVTVKLFLF